MSKHRIRNHKARFGRENVRFVLSVAGWRERGNRPGPAGGEARAEETETGAVDPDRYGDSRAADDPAVVSPPDRPGLSASASAGETGNSHGSIDSAF